MFLMVFVGSSWRKWGCCDEVRIGGRDCADRGWERLPMSGGLGWVGEGCWLAGWFLCGFVDSVICLCDGCGVFEELCELIVGCLATLSGRENGEEGGLSGIGLMIGHLVRLSTVCFDCLDFV